MSCSFKTFAVIDSKTQGGVFALEKNKVSFVIRQDTPDEKRTEYPIDKVETVEFVETMHEWKISFHLDNKTTLRFVGVKNDDKAKVQTACGELGLETVTRAANLTGRTWGDLEIRHGLATLSLDNKVSFDVPLSSLNQSISQSKHELELLCKLQAEPKDSLMELTTIRFYIPGSNSTNDNPADEMNQVIKQESENLNSESPSIVRIDDIQLGQPRGKYTFQFREDGLQLQSKTYSNLIPWGNIKRSYFFSESADMKQLVLGFSPPLKIGSTSHNLILVDLPVGPEITIQINATEDDLKNKWDGKLDPEMTDTVQNLFPFLIQAFCGSKLIGADKTFESRNGFHSVGTSYKGNEGSLYFAKKQIFFLKKPLVMIRFDDIKSVQFTDLDTQGTFSRTFGLLFKMKQDGTRPMEFLNIDNLDFDALFQHFDNVGLEVEQRARMSELVGKLATGPMKSKEDIMEERRVKRTIAMLQAEDEDDDDDDDDDYQESGSSDSDDDDDDDDSDDDGRRKKKSSKKSSKKDKKDKKSSKKDKKDKKDKKSSKKDKKDKKDKKRSHGDMEALPMDAEDDAVEQQAKKQRGNNKGTESGDEEVQLNLA